MVELLHLYYNPSRFLNPLASVMEKIQAEAVESGQTNLGTVQGKHPGLWRITDRLTEQDVVALLEAYREGTPSRVLATRYGISPTSVKRLLREHEVRRP